MKRPKGVIKGQFGAVMILCYWTDWQRTNQVDLNKTVHMEEPDVCYYVQLLEEGQMLDFLDYSNFLNVHFLEAYGIVWHQKDF